MVVVVPLRWLNLTITWASLLEAAVFAGSHAHHHRSHSTLAFSCSHTKIFCPSCQHTSMRAARPSLSLAPAYLKRLVAAATLYNACAHGLAAAGNGGPEKHIDFL